MTKNKIKLVFSLKQVAQSRPRFIIKNKKVLVYDKNKPDKKIRSFNALTQLGGFYIDKGYPVKISIWFNFKRPKSLKKDPEHHVIKPDIDNLQKLLFDSLNKLAWYDDCQINEVHCYKQYTKKEETIIIIEGVSK